MPTQGRSLLRPDLFMMIAAGEHELRWFIEVDRATHHAPALLRKARLYENYYRAGIEQAEHGVFPRVLWVVPSHERAGELTRLFGRSEFTEGLMVVATESQAVTALAGDAG